MKTEAKFVMCDEAGGSEKNAAFVRETSGGGSPPRHSTPVRQIEKKQRNNGFSSGIAAFNLLPAHHITPPSGLTKFIARNPFDADLTSRLHLSVISPTVFTKVCPTAGQDSPGFSWSVDELALIHPAKIEEFPVQQMHSTDPEVEVVAQAAINKFFMENQIIPSPWANEKKEKAERAEPTEMSTPSRPLEDLNSTSREIHKNKRNCWSQTVLTLPPVLPKHAEDALKPFLTFNQNQNVDNEDANSSNGSLRRKLFFNHEDCTEDEEESSFSLSPSKLDGSALQSSPPRSGMLDRGTPLADRSFVAIQRTHGTPYAGNFSPPNVSPIGRNDTSCQSYRSRCQLAARLDFTAEMSIDRSILDDDDGLKRLEDVDEFDTSASSMIRSRIEPMIRPDNETAWQARNGISDYRNELREENFNLTTITSDWLKIDGGGGGGGGGQRHDTILGNSGAGHRSWNGGHSTQDTGYQTRSITNITENTENTESASVSISVAPSSKNFPWNDKIFSNGEEIILSDFEDNMKNMFSSTPSKYSRRKDH